MNVLLNFSKQILLILIIFSIASQPLLSTVQAQPNSADCQVQITSDWDRRVMFPGQEANFKANVTNTTSSQLNYTWSVEGPIIKDYDDSVRSSDYFKSTANIGNYSLMTESDFEKDSIKFYWQENETEPLRTVSVLVKSSNGEICEDSVEYQVGKSVNINFQPEDFYTEYNHKLPFGNPNNPVLREHLLWHNMTNVCCDQNYNGTLFLDFHHLFLAHFDAFRHLFGYDNLTSWNPNTDLPRGVNTSHANREILGFLYYPYLNQSLPEWFKIHPNNTGPEKRTPTDNGCDPAMNNTLNLEDSLGDFGSNKSVLGCAITDPFHNSVHGMIGQNRDTDGDGQPDISGDMNDPATAPKDPIFWLYHTFINEVSLNRSTLEPISQDTRFFLVTPNVTQDNIEPQIVSQNPFRLQPFITELPRITEQDKDLFGTVDAEAISVEFNEPVLGVKADNLLVNGSASKQVNGSGAGPYVFIGFESPTTGPMNVTMLSDNITDLSGNNFTGDSWKYVLVNDESDLDLDGAKDDIEVNILLTNPTNNDTDKDSIPDGFEAVSGCLDPLINDRHLMDISGNIINSNPRDQDEDKVSSIEEFRIGTDPCIADQVTQQPSASQQLSRSDNQGIMPLIPPSLLTIQEEPRESFTLEIKKTGGISGENTKISYNSLNKELMLLTNNNETRMQVSQADDSTARRVLVNSGFFDSQTVYPPLPNSTDYQEYTMIAALNGDINSVYWTTASEEVPEPIRNLPFLLSSIFNIVI